MNELKFCLKFHYGYRYGTFKDACKKNKKLKKEYNRLRKIGLKRIA